MKRAAGWIGLAGVAVLVAGVVVAVHFGAGFTTERSTTFPVQSPVPRPTQACAGAGVVALPAGFVAVRAEQCVLATVAVPGDGEWQVQQDQRVDGGLTALVAALPWRTVATTPLHRIRTQLEVDSGCPGAYKPVVSLDADRGRTGAGPVDLGDPTALGVCRYRLDAGSTIDGYQGGVLVGADRLTGTARSAVLVAIRAAKPVTGPCDRPQQPFAVLVPAGGSPGPVVELGGCDRLDVGGQLYQLDATTVSVLSG